MKVIISGAGVGGLTAALCFLQHGAEVAVLERAPALGEVGRGNSICAAQRHESFSSFGAG